MLNEPIRLMLMTLANSASGIGPSLPTMRAAGPMPAQLIRMRAGPFLARASATADSALAASATSHLTAMPPVSFATFWALSILTSRMATLAPPAASARAVAAPSPDPPPVISAACPLTCMVAPALTSQCPRRFLTLIPADLIRGSIHGGSETVSGMDPRVKPEGIRKEYSTEG
jgi:hypothetical protein